MQILFEIGPELQKTVSNLTDAAQQLHQAVNAGLEDGCKQIAAIGQSEFLSGQYLKRRTGNLARALDGWMAGDLEGVIGVRDQSAVDKYKWLLGDNPEHQPLIIRPKTKKFLAIPIGENFTGAGVPRYNSPRDVPEDMKPFFLRGSDGQLFFAYRAGKTKRARIRLLFALVKEVEVYDTGALPDAVLDNLDKINDRINDQIGGLLS
ncbi:MAG: BNR repeat-containing protein [Planctomycetaceae bacterium]|nr:BNR repeat-containing protein [Planctomycetaceae bacterium]